MASLLGLLSLAGLSLFLSRALSRSASLTPLVAVAACMLWFTLAGVLGLLVAGGIVWYAACLAALAWVVYKERGALLARLTPGWLLFLLGGAFFIVYFSLSRPLLTHWDEFTFWGTAAKAVSETNQLYTVANSNLIARSYPPGLILLSYATQFFYPGFWEGGLLAALALLYLACFAAGSAVLDGRKAAAVLLLAALCLLPFLFETAPAGGSMSWAYGIAYADPSLAALFGGALCLYFAPGERDWRLAMMLSLVLAALTNVKDMGLALAFLVALVAGADLLFCRLGEMTLWRLKRWGALAATLLFWCLCIAGTYALWAAHLALLPEGVNRFDLSSSGGETALSPVGMLTTGLLALFGVGRSEQFSRVLSLMLTALADRPVWLLGSGLRLLAVIALLLLFTWLLCRTRAQRRRVVVFALFSALGFVLFYIFNIFTYAYVFSALEAGMLKDYERYIGPYWQGWLAATLALLAATAVGREGAAAWRTGLARLTLTGATLAVLAAVALRGNPAANFLRVSPSLYGMREAIGQVVGTAKAEGMRAGDVVYTVNQYDDGTRFYILGFEMAATRVPLFGGGEYLPDGRYDYDEGNVAANLRPLGSNDSGYNYDCSPEILSGYLAKMGCTHLLIDRADGAFVEEYAGMFADGMAGYAADGEYEGGHRYWRIEYGADGLCRFLPEGGAA